MDSARFLDQTPAALLKTILESTNEGFWLIDNDTITLDANPTMCLILGRPLTEILGKHIALKNLMRGAKLLSIAQGRRTA